MDLDGFERGSFWRRVRLAEDGKHVSVVGAKVAGGVLVVWVTVPASG